MTSKIKCPICQNNLHKINIVVSTCTNDKCKLWGSSIPNLVLKALTQTKQDLKIARRALKDIKAVCDNCRWCDSNLYDPTPNDGRRIAETTNNALTQIEHKE